MYYNDLPVFLNPVTCAVTGHRTLGENFNKDENLKNLEKLISEGYANFLIGMAIGFDEECFSALLTLKEKHNIKITAVIPCLDQSRYFSEENKKTYNNHLIAADYKVIFYEKYRNGCMFERNDFLVKNSSVLYAYYNGKKRGGTFYTVNRAIKNDEKIVFYGEKI